MAPLRAELEALQEKKDTLINELAGLRYRRWLRLLAAALLPPYRERGAVIALLAPALLLVAISCMNNWRGGWTVGPRYLTPILPFLAWRALQGLRRLPARPARIFALGALAVGLLLSGLPSAWYPHVPPKIPFPLTGQLWPMLKAGELPFLPPLLLGAAWFVSQRGR